VNGESCQFCCYGCCIAHQVKSGSGDASEAAWLLVRLGVGSFLSMNIMLFSLLVYSGAFTGADRGVLPTIQLLLWGLATPAVLILGEPFLRETWSQLRRGRLSSPRSSSSAPLPLTSIPRSPSFGWAATFISIRPRWC
jgi:P-type Cu2+ transporter